MTVNKIYTALYILHRALEVFGHQAGTTLHYIILHSSFFIVA